MIDPWNRAKKSQSVPMVAAFLLVAQLTLVGGAAGDVGEARSAAPAAQEPRNLDDFEILEYVAARAYPPSTSIALDNNSEILMACRNGRTIESLRESGLEFADSQIEFLVAMNLMFRDGRGDLYTAFPILDEAAVTALRGEMSTLADGLSATVLPQVRALSEALESVGESGHEYSVVLSYVLDGMVWGFLEEYRRVVPRRLSVRYPYWSGEIWAVRPGREFRAGTRSIEQGGLTLKISSIAGFADPSSELFDQADILKKGLKQIAKQGGLDEGEAKRLYERLGLVDKEGSWTIPRIDEVQKGPVFRAAEGLTSDLVDALLETVDLEGLQDRYGFRTPQQALVIAYHELMWDLMQHFESAGLTEKPEALLASSKLRPLGFGEVALVVDRRMPEPDRRDAVDSFDSLEPEKEASEEPRARADG